METWHIYIIYAAIAFGSFLAGVFVTRYMASKEFNEFTEMAALDMDRAANIADEAIEKQLHLLNTIVNVSDYLYPIKHGSAQKARRLLMDGVADLIEMSRQD